MTFDWYVEQAIKFKLGNSMAPIADVQILPTDISIRNPKVAIYVLHYPAAEYHGYSAPLPHTYVEQDLH
jgi:hypothetical protein